MHSGMLLKAVHDYEHVHVTVYVGWGGMNTPGPGGFLIPPALRSLLPTRDTEA